MRDEDWGSAMGVGWGAAALVAGMAIVVLLALDMVAASSREGPVRVRAALLVGCMVVVGWTSWLVFQPITYDAPGGPISCHTATTEDADQGGEDTSCHDPAVRRRWEVFGPLALVGLVAVGALVLPAARRRDGEGGDDPDRPGTGHGHAASATEEAWRTSGMSRPGPAGTVRASGQPDQPT